MTARAEHVRTPSSLTPLDPIEGVRTTAQLRTVRHADDRKPMLNHYIREARVGNGQHGEVYLCYDLNDNRREVAIKAVKRHNPRAEKWNLMRRKNLPSSPHTALTDRLGTTEHKIRKEIAIMKKCRHGHVVRLLEVIDDKLKEKIYMVMEYLGGGEVKWVNMYHQPIQTVDQTRRIIRDVILGLEYLHYQGIIHRDIKPANLLWTSDRSMVKISDFGVSHFSYAQRLAAAGKSKQDLDNSHDPILLDDSDLSKTAGTPSFLAPEVVFDASAESSPVNSASNTVSTLENPSQGTATPVPRRQPITKAIDIWALGVTLYCLLFGQVPFISKDGHEWSLYKVISTQEWSVPERMGFDQLETGGRHPKKRDSEGFIIVNLLDQLLQKDARQRATLDQVKRHPWFTRDLPNPEQWLRETAPNKNDIVEVTELETNTAMSPLHFRWGWGKRITSHISSFLRNVRPQRSSVRSPGQTICESQPSLHSTQRGGQVVRAKSAYSTVGRSASAGPRKGSFSRRDKGKRRADPYSSMTSASIISTGRSKSIERYTLSQDTTLTSARVKARRGSETLLTPPLPRQRNGSSTPLSRPSPGPSGERLRTRFSLSSILRWRPKYSPQAVSPPDPLSSSAWSTSPKVPPLNGVQCATLVDQFSRRSEEALRHLQTAHSIVSEPLTAARRASSWGENPTDFMEEAASLNSEEAAELDHDAMILGAGGVCNDRFLEPQVVSASAPERFAHGFIHSPVPEHTAAGRGSCFMRYTHSTSPLTQVAYDSRSNVDGGEGDDVREDDNDSDEVYSSSVEEFDDLLEDDTDGDDDEDEDDAAPIEVRRRLPTSPPPQSDSPVDE